MQEAGLSREEFLSPTASWRGKPFWSWNGKLEKDELLRQIHLLKDMGMGGYFMHSRTGLETPYLGEEWFALTNACVEEDERLGLESWLYDEDRWPSGTAGGRVTANPEYRMKFLYMAKFSGDTFDLGAWQKSEQHPLGAWSCRLKNEIDIYDVTKATEATTADALSGKTVLAFSVRPMASGSFYNGNTYVALGDTLDVEVCITRKNTCGPLHLKNPRPNATGPGQFSPGPDQFSLEPVFMQSGLLAPVEIIS